MTTRSYDKFVPRSDPSGSSTGTGTLGTGAFSDVVDTTELSALPSGSLTAGEVAWMHSDRSFWVLENSGATVDGVRIIAAQSGGAWRWHRIPYEAHAQLVADSSRNNAALADLLTVSLTLGSAQDLELEGSFACALTAGAIGTWADFVLDLDGATLAGAAVSKDTAATDALRSGSVRAAAVAVAAGVHTIKLRWATDGGGTTVQVRPTTIPTRESAYLSVRAIGS